jgi:hypothetical protein
MLSSALEQDRFRHSFNVRLNDLALMHSGACCQLEYPAKPLVQCERWCPGYSLGR